MAILQQGVTKDARTWARRCIGQVRREGATTDAILKWLREEGVPDPEKALNEVIANPPAPMKHKDWARAGGRAALRTAVGLDPNGPPTHLGRMFNHDDFVAYLPEHTYICIPTGDDWKPESIKKHVAPPEDSAVEICDWLDVHRHVEQMSWLPGRDKFVRDVMIADGGLIDRHGVSIYNIYRPPLAYEGGDPLLAVLWVEHMHRLYGEYAEHIIRWCASRVQYPQVKINHGLVLGGNTRIGKDTLLIPVREAIGAWNMQEIGPTILMGRFNGYLKTVILRVSEGHDLGEINRYALYERTKTLLAAPPEIFRVDEKNLKEHPVPNIVGVIFTTNHKDGLYLPPDDARHYVAWSDQRQDDMRPFCEALYDFYEAGGLKHIVAYLRQPSLLKDFHAKRPPEKTPAWYDMVQSGKSSEESELHELLDLMGSPDVVTVPDLMARTLHKDISATLHEFGSWLADRRNQKAVPHKLGGCGYCIYRNPDDKHDGQWKIDGKRLTLYVKAELNRDQRAKAVYLKRSGPRDPGPSAAPEGIPF